MNLKLALAGLQKTGIPLIGYDATMLFPLFYKTPGIATEGIDDIGIYIDPCDVDYNAHFYRDELGNIYPVENSDSAKYMYRKLKLYLKRYSIIWMLEQLEIKKEKLRALIEATKDKEAIELYVAIDFKYMDYKKHLKAIL